jgi:hypothetical protein
VTVGSPSAPGLLPAGTVAAKKPKPATAAHASRMLARRVTERSKPNSTFDLSLPQSSPLLTIGFSTKGMCKTSACARGEAGVPLQRLGTIETAVLKPLDWAIRVLVPRPVER